MLLLLLLLLLMLLLLFYLLLHRFLGQNQVEVENLVDDALRLRRVWLMRQLMLTMMLPLFVVRLRK